MSEHDRLQRRCRLWIYVIALLHLVCLGLLHRPAQPGAQFQTHYARRAILQPAAPPATATRTI